MADAAPAGCANPEGFLVCVAAATAGADPLTAQGKLALALSWWSCYMGFCRQGS